MVFATTLERLQYHFKIGWYLYGFYNEEQLIGYVAISQVENTDKIYEIHNLAILPEYRHKGYGKQLLDFCLEKVKKLGGIKITVGIIEENSELRNWYASFGFLHTGTKKFDFFPFTCGYMEYLI